MTAMPGSNAPGPPEPVGGRTVGDLVLDADIAARELLWDAPPDTAKAKARSWGEVVDEKGVYPVRIIESVDHGRQGATDGRLPAPWAAHTLPHLPASESAPARVTNRAPLLAEADLPVVPVPGVPGMVVRSALLGAEEMARILGIPITTVKNWVRSGEVPCIWLGKHPKFTPGHLGEIILAGERRPAASSVPTPKRNTARTKL